MRMRLPFALMMILGQTGAASAGGSFQINRDAVVKNLRAVINRSELSSSELVGRCGKPLNLKTCRYFLQKGIEIQIVETYSKRVPRERFWDGADGDVYEVAVLRDTSPRASSDAAAFKALCASAVTILRPKTKPEAARDLVERLIRKAEARSDDPAQARQSDRNSSVIIDLSPDALNRCRITAETEYLPATGVYRAGEDVP